MKHYSKGKEFNNFLGKSEFSAEISFSGQRMCVSSLEGLSNKKDLGSIEVRSSLKCHKY